MKTIGKIFGLLIAFLLFSYIVSQCSNKVKKNLVETTPVHVKIDVQHIIDSAQNVIRDSIKNVNANKSYWSAYETGLPKGIVEKMSCYDGTDFKLDGKTSTDDEYGLILIKTKDGELITAVVTHDQYIMIEPNDEIK